MSKLIEHMVDLRTWSESGIVLLVTVLEFQSQVKDRARAIDEGKRANASKLLNNMAQTIESLEREIRSETPIVDPLLGKMRVYLAAFKDIFEPLLGKAAAGAIYDRLAELFLARADGGPLLVHGLLEMKKHHGSSDQQGHCNAAIATLTLAAEQLFALAEIVEFPEAFS
ncbi:hypothetical protein [Mesobacterium pallidum]|uniref:hypothetical protein n=1 Tax=Mesobacterium pallidum TaxID=2872037 RepID=UPI001EE3068B|nr:hypothetical protein [Mesobacterium pallidum]